MRQGDEEKAGSRVRDVRHARLEDHPARARRFVFAGWTKRSAAARRSTVAGKTSSRSETAKAKSFAGRVDGLMPTYMKYFVL